MYMCIIYIMCVLYYMCVLMALSGGFSLLPLQPQFISVLVQGADDQHHRDGEGILTLLGITLGGTIPFLRT
jgi:hypothetical protein